MNFLIIFGGQEGSTSIVEHMNNFDSFSLLSGNVGDLDVYEPFDDYMFTDERYGGFGKKIDDDSLLQCIKSFFERDEKNFLKNYGRYNNLMFFKKLKKNIFSGQNIGFKIFIRDKVFLEKLVTLCGSLECTIFILQRKDILKWAISKSQGHLKQYDLLSNKIFKSKIEVDIESIQKSLNVCKEMQNKKDELIDLCIKLKANHLNIYYEDFLNDKLNFFKKISRALEMPTNNVSLYLKRPTKLKKVHYDKLKNILNYRDIKSRFPKEVENSNRVDEFYKDKDKKIKIKSKTIWPHLRYAWNTELICLHNPYSKIVLEDYLDGFFGSENTINEPWIGFFHNTPKNHWSTNDLYGFQNDTSLESILHSESFERSINKCQGIFTLSEYLKDFIQKKFPELLVESLFLYTEKPRVEFSFEKFKKNPSIVTIGHWQRLFNHINKIKKVEKFFLKWSSSVDVDCWFGKQKITKDKDLKVLERLDNYHYDNLLEKTVVFLELYDAAANNIVVECIVRNNPIIVNKIPGLFDYLGKDYPLFYEDYEQAQNLVTDYDKIFSGYNYLKKINKEKFKSEYFFDSFKQSKIYSSLPSYKIF